MSLANETVVASGSTAETVVTTRVFSSTKIGAAELVKAGSSSSTGDTVTDIFLVSDFPLDVTVTLNESGPKKSSSGT